MERIDKCTTAKSRRKTNRNTPPSRKSTRNLTMVTSKDNLAGYSEYPGDISEPYFMDVWVKQEIHLDQDQVEQTIIEGRTIEHVNVATEDCHDDVESATYNFDIDFDPNIVKDEHSSEYVLPDHLSGHSENESNKLSFLEQELDLCKSRNLELEEIVNKQKIEIKQLRKKHKNCVCVNVLRKKNNDNYKAQKDRVVDEYMTFCPVCRKDLTTIRRKYDRERHLRTCRDGSKFKCLFCKVTYSRKKGLTKHIQKCEIKNK